MKKFFAALMCMILATGAAMAQKQFTFGPKVGMDLTNFWGKGLPHGMQFNYQAGLFLEYRFTDKFSLAPEVVFAAQGGKMNAGVFYDGASSNTDLFFHFNYINVLVMMKFYATPKLSIDFGPQIGFNVYNKTTTKAKPGNTYTREVSDVKSIDFGLGLGATYNFTDRVFVQGRYTMGMTKVIENYDVMNGNIQLAVGYRF
jgi:hypothetical protein